MKKETVSPDTFKFLSPEEIDNHIKEKVGGKRGRHAWTETELTMRNQVIIDLIGQGLSRRRIVEELMARWGIQAATASGYIKEAYELMFKNNEEFVQYNRDKQIERLENIITEALQQNEFKAAVMATAELNKLLGLTTTQKVALENVDRVFKFGGEN